jgi:hypothetical protein
MCSAWFLSVGDTVVQYCCAANCVGGLGNSKNAAPKSRSFPDPDRQGTRTIKGIFDHPF